ncbi:MAG TPA: beta-N-acetylhexosaminidase [Casimicrobiaceae bacterium]|nr:beta-N-acetylhexosaminidase [Casimicrobiaceae bacterium]
MLGIEGLALTADDRARLVDPRVGGVILFARNFESSAQLRALNETIRALRPELVIGVDHEGGRVQRFRADEFSAIPAMRSLGHAWDSDPATANDAAFRHGRTIAGELRAHGVDVSFTPVLDLDYGASTIIGDRAFHADPVIVADLASALLRGLSAGGVAGVGKHFPGHGFVAADSHVDTPVDDRALDTILRTDIVPFAALIQQALPAIMPAHVVYPKVDAQPAGFSRVWIGEILRQRLGFDGLVFSDDLEMAGAHGAGDIVERANAALDAGCDVVLVCNDFDTMDDLLARWLPPLQPDLARRWSRMTPQPLSADAATARRGGA